MAWSFVVCDLGAEQLGEVRNAHNRRVERPLGRLDVASFRIRPDNAMAGYLLDGDVLVKAYDGVSDVPKFVGEVASADEVATDTDASLQVVCGGALARLEDRLVGKSVHGVEYGDAISQLDRGAIAEAILDDVNGDRDTGVRVGTITPSSLSYAGPYWYKAASEAIAELGAAFDGFDFEFAPVEPVADGAGLHLWDFNAAPAIGADRPDTILEYGFGTKSLVAYTRRVDRRGLLTKGYGLPPGFPDNAKDPTIVSASDSAAIAERGLHEGVVQADIGNADLRQRLVDEHVLVRKRPRQLITFTVAFSTPYVYGTDYREGDTIRARAVVNDEVRFNAAFRIYGVAWNIDDEDNVRIELTVTPTDAAL